MVQSSHAFLIISSMPIIFRPNDPRLFLQFFGKRNISGSYYSRFFNHFLEEYCTNMKTRCLHACTYFQQARCPKVHSNKDYKFCRYQVRGNKDACTPTPTAFMVHPHTPSSSLHARTHTYFQVQAQLSEPACACFL